MQILFIDAEPNQLKASQHWMEHYSNGTWKIHSATSAGQALGILQNQLIDLVALDIHLPLVDGVQFLRLLTKKFPSVLKVVVTDEANDTFRVACLDEGADLFLEKPREEHGWQALYATLAELVKHNPTEEGFRGILRKVGIHDVLQLECLAGNSSILEISSDSDRGAIYIEAGKIVHAQSGTLRGVDAFFHLFTLTSGEFVIKPFSPPPQFDIVGYSWETLLLDAARRRDENAVRPAQKQTGPPSPPIKPFALPPKPDDALLRPKVDEMLVSSPEGEVLYEWHCQNPHGRISLFELLSEKTEPAASILGLGKFERLEGCDNQSRFVARIQPENAILVVTNLVPALETTEPKP